MAAIPPAPGCLDDALDWLRKHFDPEAARELRVAYQYELGGPGGGRGPGVANSPPVGFWAVRIGTGVSCAA